MCKSTVPRAKSLPVALSNRSTEQTRVEEKQKEFLCLLSWSVHNTIWLVMVTLSPPVAVPKAWYKNTLSLVMVYSPLFNDVFKALNLFLNKYASSDMA
jgi:hypothetical protein